MLGLSRKYKSSKTEIDKLSDFFSNKSKFNNNFSKSNNERSISNQTHQSNNENTGYCIRTGKPIPFNIEKPMSYDAYKAWNKNPDNPEYYCHFSGEESNGQTSVNRPILNKNWKKAQQFFDL